MAPITMALYLLWLHLLRCADAALYEAAVRSLASQADAYALTTPPPPSRASKPPPSTGEGMAAPPAPLSLLEPAVPLVPRHATPEQSGGASALGRAYEIRAECFAPTTLTPTVPQP